MNEPDQGRSLTLAEAIIPIASLIILVGLSFYLFGDEGASGPNQVALVVATMIAVFVAWRRGFTLDELRDAAVASVGSGMGAVRAVSQPRHPDRNRPDRGAGMSERQFRRRRFQGRVGVYPDEGGGAVHRRGPGTRRHPLGFLSPAARNRS